MHEVVDTGYSVDDLVRALTKIMVESETGGERQCEAFAAEILTEGEMQAMLAQTGNGRRNSNNRKPKTSNNTAPTPTTGNTPTYWADNREKPKGGPYCHKCAKFYAKSGTKTEKDAAIRSHYTADCWWKNSNQPGGGNGNSKGGGKGNKKGGVIKDGEKNRAQGEKKGDKGKGKGKGKGRKGNF
jgi:hypothetical protein